MKSTRLACLLAACLLATCLLAATTKATEANHRENIRITEALQHGLRPSVLKTGEPVPAWSLQERMAHYRVPGVAIAVVRNGDVVYTAGFGVREAGTQERVDADTLFSVGSVSKMIAAATTLRYTAQGQIDLDRDVHAYLKSWRIPASPDIKHPTVTMRMLLSHTSGLNVHGFQDYLPGETLPTLTQTLNGTPPAKNEPVRLRHEPGGQSDYSGGGIMVEQQIIEDISGTSFVEAAKAQVFDPIGMRRSTYENPLPAERGNIAKAHDKQGMPTALPRGWQAFPEQAASGLWTSSNDLGVFVSALIKSYQGKSTFLPRDIAIQMMTEVSPGSRGLGPELSGAGTSRKFFHNGNNDSYYAGIEGYPETGDGFAILTNGKNAKALRGEIRNALSDLFGDGVKPLIRTIDLDLSAPAYADYAGTYRLDTNVPMDIRGGLADWFDFATLAIKVADGAISITPSGETKSSALLALTPTRFMASAYGIDLQFHRDARGGVQALSVEGDGSRAYYRRQTQEQTTAADTESPPDVRR